MKRQRASESRGIGQEFARLLSEPRRLLRMKRGEVAGRAEVDEATVARWERAERLPSAKQIARLTQALTSAQVLQPIGQSPHSPNGNVTSRIRVLLVEDHDLVRATMKESLEAEPDIDVIGDLDSAHGALTAIKQTAPHLAIIDIRLGQTSGLDLAQIIRSAQPDVNLLILSGYDYAQYVRRAAAIGIEGYVTKDAPAAELVQTIRRVACGEIVLPLKVASRVLGSIVHGSPEPPQRCHWNQLAAVLVTAAVLAAAVFFLESRYHWVAKFVYGDAPWPVACEKLPTLERTLETVREHEDILAQIEAVGQNGSVWYQVDSRRCPGKADIIIYYATRSQLQAIRDIIGRDTFFGIPFRMSNL